MAKEPDARYPSAGDLGRAALAAAAAGDAPRQPERMVARGAAAPAARRPSSTAGRVDASPRPVRRRAARAAPKRRCRRARCSAALALAATAAIVAFVVTARPAAAPTRDDPRRRRPSTTSGERPNGVARRRRRPVGDERHADHRRRGSTPPRAASSASTPTVGLGASSIVSAGTQRLGRGEGRTRTSSEIDAAQRARRRRAASRAGRRGGSPSGSGSLWVATLADGARAAELVRYDSPGTSCTAGRCRAAWRRSRPAAGSCGSPSASGERVLRLDPRTAPASRRWATLAGPDIGAVLRRRLPVGDASTTADSIARVNPRRAENPVTTLGRAPAGPDGRAGGRLFVASSTDHTVLVFDPRSAEAGGSAARGREQPVRDRGRRRRGVGDGDLGEHAHADRLPLIEVARARGRPARRASGSAGAPRARSARTARSASP